MTYVESTHTMTSDSYMTRSHTQHCYTPRVYMPSYSCDWSFSLWILLIFNFLLLLSCNCNEQVSDSLTMYMFLCKQNDHCMASNVGIVRKYLSSPNCISLVIVLVTPGKICCACLFQALSYPPAWECHRIVEYETSLCVVMHCCAHSSISTSLLVLPESWKFESL